MTKKQRGRLDADTCMANLSADKCFQALSEGRFFSLEHPEGSIARSLPSWKKLASHPEVETIRYTTCMFEGSERRKRQVLLTNVGTMRAVIGKGCNGTMVCDRTGKKHKRWRPQVIGGRVTQFSTGEEREYPVGFCRAYARGVAELKSGGRFLEIFSGPNAPLSQAVADIFGAKVPGEAIKKKGRGVSNELQSLSQLVDSKVFATPSTAGSPAARVEQLPFRLAAVESGRQPSYGKRTQLIPDDLNSAKSHFRESLKIRHPFGGDSSIKEDHVRAISWQDQSSVVNNTRRLRILAELRILARCPSLAIRQSEMNASACRNSSKLLVKPKTALMEKLQAKFSIEDTAVPSLCLQGMPIVGDASGEETSRAIYQKTLKEVSQGTMSGPLTPQEVTKRFGKFWNLVPSFGLHQGEDEAGNPKFRRIDDHTTSWNNLAATRKQKIPMAMIDYVVNMTRELFKARGKTLACFH